MKVYCEHGAITGPLRDLQRQRRVQLVHFPFDPNSRSRHIAATAVPSDAQWRDVNLSWAELKELGWTWGDLEPSPHLARIAAIIGPGNRRDALHIDAAYKSGCRAFVTRDTDILNQRDELAALLGISFIEPDRDFDILKAILDSERGAV
jgi:hypothetical protein